MFVLLYAAIVLGFFLLLLLLTFGANGWNYMSIDAVVANLENNFLIGLYIALPTVFVFVTTILTRSMSFARYGWWIAVGIAAVRLLILLVTSRWRLIRFPLFLPVTIVSVVLAYGVCHAVLADHSALTTLSPNLVVIIMWFVTVLVVAKLLSEAQFGNLDADGAYNHNVHALYAKYSRQFDSVITPYFRRDPVAYRLLFAIMISEDINRPGIVRLMERLLFPFKNIATTGIMQVTANEYLSNQRSVTIAQQLIKGSYARHKRRVKEEYSLVRAVAGDYNGGVYPELVADIYFILKEREYKFSMSAI